MSLRYILCGKSDYIILNKSFYGLVQAAWQYFKKSCQDPDEIRIHVQKSEKGIVYVALYIDKNLMTGNIEAIDKAITAFKENGLVWKTVKWLQDYMSCEVKFSMDKKKDWLGQPHLIENLAKNFCIHIKNFLSHKTPGMPTSLMIRPMIKSTKISAENQEYKLRVGMLLYLVKHLWPDITNATRERSKANDSANPAAYKEFPCVIKHVLDITNLGLKIEPTGKVNNPWDIVCFSDNNYAGDVVSRRSIIGFILYAQGVSVSWQSKSHQSVSLSSSEVEYIALSEVV